jgi:hypothetical protein
MIISGTGSDRRSGFARMMMRSAVASFGHNRSAYVEPALVALLVFAAFCSIPGFTGYLAHIATSALENLHAN